MPAIGDMGTGLDQLLDALPNRVWLLDREHRVLWANRQAAAFLDRDPADIAGMTLADTLGSTDAPEDLAERTAALDGIAGIWTGWSLYPDGRRRFTERRFLPRESTPGTVDAYFEFTSDRTELMAAREAADRAERLLRDAMSSLPDGLGIEGDDGRLAACNPAYSAIYGVAPEILIGMSFEERMAIAKDRLTPVATEGPNDGPDEAYRNLIRLRRESLEPFEARHVDGRHFLLQRAPTLEGGRVVLLTDVSILRAQEAELARQRDNLHQAEKLAALGEVLAGVSHELNNPLSVLVGQAAILQETAPDDTVRRRAERLSEAAGRCARIVRSFLAMARQRPTDVSEVDVGRLAREALVIAGPELAAAGAEATLDLSPYPLHAAGDAEQLRQVVVNLVTNAAQALAGRPEPRQVSVTVRLDGRTGHVRLRVADTGPGVPAAIASRVFEPLFTTKVGKGAGIGLALCHRVVTAHGGSISLEAAPGGGAAFVVELPLAGSGETAGMTQAIRPPGAGLTVLVLDDDADVLRTTAELLELDGHAVVPALTARQALGFLAGADPDVIISDIRMPDIDGLEFHRLVAARRPALAGRFIFATGDTLSPDVARHIREMGRPCLEKPFLPDDIRAILRQLAPLSRG